MEPYQIIMFAVIGIIILAAVMYCLIKKKKNNKSEDISEAMVFSTNSRNDLSELGSRTLTYKFEDLPALTEQEENSLVEIKDNKLLARIDNVVPGAAQVVINTGAVNNAQQAVKEAGKLYQVILKKPGALVQSKNMEGAVRAFTRDANGIKENANLIQVDLNQPVQGLANVNIANAAMGAAAMVVGQYYMTQINDQLDGINENISKIADFQDNEYKSKVYALVAEIQKCATFQVETMENNELRNRELAHLKNLEHECAQLLGQANITLEDFSKKNGLDYDKYEKAVGEANSWYQYQQILLEVMYKIGDLTYALNLGAISRENSYAMYLPYSKQAEGALAKLNAWHKENGAKFEIDLGSIRRKRQGIEGFFMHVPAIFNNDLNYKAIPEKTASMISKQSIKEDIIQFDGKDLFQEDVQLIAKDGKLYYLPKVI